MALALGSWRQFILIQHENTNFYKLEAHRAVRGEVVFQGEQ